MEASRTSRPCYRLQIGNTYYMNEWDWTEQKEIVKFIDKEILNKYGRGKTNYKMFKIQHILTLFFVKYNMELNKKL